MTTPRQTDDTHIMAALRERVKELGCLYAVSQILAGEQAPRAERMRRIAETLPPAWQFPAAAVARITLDGASWTGGNEGRPVVSQRTALMVDGADRGAIEVGYTALPHGVGADAAFLPEERSLLEEVGRQVSMYLTREESAARRTQLEAQLRHADRLATIGQLAAGVAHEMNDPLGNILGLAQLALKAPDAPPQVAADLREIVAATLRAREIVRKLLLFAHQTPPALAPTDLNRIVEEATSLLETGCRQRGIQLERRAADGLPTIEADPVQIRQVVVNLTVNAMQAVERGGSISIETRVERGGVVLVVADTGHGMSEDVLRRIFTPFFTTKDVGEGTGLGLSVVHGIVTSHGGTIDVESREGAGSRFVVWLPITRPVACTPA